ncbi:hypothetical protein [Parafrankia soli]|uniref:hypothetical protein n=1 Tax=Parafrankia soli TaxID=2599596 RepID=UPI001F5161C8|nr:hypothetical protein [Parafrankia soli]
MRIRKLLLRSAVACAGVGLALLVTACGGGGTDDDSATAGASSASEVPHTWATDVPDNLTGGSATPAPAVTVAAAAPTASTSADPRTGVIPADFPFPPGATVTVSDSKPTDATLNLAGVTPAATLAFYRQALPGAGYKFFQEGGSEPSAPARWRVAASTAAAATGWRAPDAAVTALGRSQPTRRPGYRQGLPDPRRPAYRGRGG